MMGIDKRLLCIALIVFSFSARSQVVSSLKKDSTDNRYTKADKVSLLLYLRGVSDAKGNKRMDENAVANFKLNKWLKFEPGLRFGQRPNYFNSYCHYKLELQTKSFWKIVRVIARISDNVIYYPSPKFRKTNELFAVETKTPLSSRWLVFADLGYVFSALQEQRTEVWPTSKGIISNYPIFKLALRYFYKEGSIEAAYGSFDVFNPYYYNSPFGQITLEHELSSLCTFYSYFRYQYAISVLSPANYFLCAGLRFHLVK